MEYWVLADGPIQVSQARMGLLVVKGYLQRAGYWQMGLFGYHGGIKLMFT